MTITKPMLAANVDDLDTLRYPLIATPKIDGIRCLIINGEARTRSLKLIQNRYIQKLLSQLPEGFDGEIMAGETFQDVTSAVMSRDGEPDFTYHVFDWERHAPYVERIQRLEEWCSSIALPYVEYVPHTHIPDRDTLSRYLEYLRIEDGEGACLRLPDGPYKAGRSTLREHYLLKVKFMDDAEATIVDFEEQMENTNAKQTNELGRSKRSSAKAGMVPKGTLGSIVAKVESGDIIHVGTGKGLTAELRQYIWDHRTEYVGKVFRFQHQSVGEKDAPRIPTFQGFRDASDMGGE